MEPGEEEIFASDTNSFSGQVPEHSKHDDMTGSLKALQSSVNRNVAGAGGGREGKVGHNSQTGANLSQEGVGEARQQQPVKRRIEIGRERTNLSDLMVVKDDDDADDLSRT